MTRLIGILGGTFDPIHFGHLHPVHHLAQQLNLFKIHYVLSARPPHKQIPVASITHRFNMLTRALETYPQSIPDDQEIRRPGPSFTVWTIRKMRQTYQDESLCLIVGMDAYLDMHNWYKWHDIVALTNIIVLPRPGWKPGRGKGAARAADLSRTAAGVVFYANAHEMPITASEIRKRMGCGKDVSDMVPEKVLTYIQKNRLYRTKECHD